MNHSSPPTSLPHGQRSPSKSPLLLLLTLGAWSGTMILLGRSLVPVVASAQTIAESLVLATFAALLVLFWLLGAYYLALVAVFFWRKIKGSNCAALDDAAPAEEPPVAILYPTCDDFQRDAVLTCLRQDYANFHVFLLDDSRTTAAQQMVDEFNREFPATTTIVRRSNRQGYKAGNLNHALRTAAEGYPLFAVMDADERIPADFLRLMVRRLQRDGSAFVQANHAPNPRQTGGFARAMGQTILPFWSMLLVHKDRYGFMPCVGHGLVVRRTAWEASGGFPEVASEDIAFSSELLALGMRGSFAPEVLCFEDFPETIQAFKKQQQRYVAGVLQAFCIYWPRLLRSRRASWIEKLDFPLCCLPLYVPIFGLAFVLTVGLGFGMCFGKMSALVIHHPLISLRMPYLQILDGRFESLWGSGFVLFSIFFSLTPSIPMLALAAVGKIKRPFRLLLVSNLAYMSTMLVTCHSVIRLAFQQSVQFLPTGSFSREGMSPSARGRNHSFAVETGLSLLIGALLFSTLNIGLGAVALAPLLSHWRRLELAAFAAFCGVALQTALSIFLGLSPWAMPSLVFSIHF